MTPVMMRESAFNKFLSHPSPRELTEAGTLSSRSPSPAHLFRSAALLPSPHAPAAFETGAVQ